MNSTQFSTIFRDKNHVESFTLILPKGKKEDRDHAPTVTQ